MSQNFEKNDAAEFDANQGRAYFKKTLNHRKIKTSHGTRMSQLRYKNDGSKIASNMLDTFNTPRTLQRHQDQLKSDDVKVMAAYCGGMEADPDQVSTNDLLSLSNTFKVSNLVKPKKYRAESRFIDLYNAKHIG